MPFLDLLRVQRRLDTVHTVLRRIQTDVIPRAERRIEHGSESVSNSIGRELETTQRVLDPDDDYSGERPRRSPRQSPASPEPDTSRSCG